jgi:hypothetical protein
MSAPFAKLTNLIGFILTIIQGATHDQITAFFATFIPEPYSNLAAVILIAFTGWLSANGHSLTGTGGTAAINDPRADKGLTANMTTRNGK